MNEFLVSTILMNVFVTCNKLCPDMQLTLEKLRLNNLVRDWTFASKRTKMWEICWRIFGKPPIYLLIEANEPDRNIRKRCKDCCQKIFMLDGSKVPNKKVRIVSAFCIDFNVKLYLYSSYS